MGNSANITASNTGTMKLSHNTVNNAKLVVFKYTQTAQNSLKEMILTGGYIFVVSEDRLN